VPVQMTMQLIRVLIVQVPLRFGASMDDPIRGGAFSVLLLFGLLAELSQIDDLAHRPRLELYSVWTLSKSMGLHAYAILLRLTQEY